MGRAGLFVEPEHLLAHPGVDLAGGDEDLGVVDAGTEEAIGRGAILFRDRPPPTGGQEPTQAGSALVPGAVVQSRQPMDQIVPGVDPHPQPLGLAGGGQHMKHDPGGLEGPPGQGPEVQGAGPGQATPMRTASARGSTPARAGWPRPDRALRVAGAPPPDSWAGT